MDRRVSEVADLQQELRTLRQEHERLRRQAADAEQAIAAFARGEVDAVTLAASTTPLLLQSAQDRLRQNERLLRAVFDGALEPMVLTDDRGRYVDANRAACELYQLPLDQLLGRTFAEFTGGPVLDDAALRAYREKGTTRGQVVITRVDGSRRTLEYSSVSNVTPGIDLSVMRDITDRAEAELALRRNEALFRAVIEKSAEIISLTSADGTTRYLTPSAWRMLGWKPEEVGARTMRDQLIPEDRARVAAELERLVRTGERDLVLDLRVRHRDGSIRWVESTGTNLLDDPEVAAIVGNYRDITARKQAEEALRASRDLLEKAQEMAHLGSWTSGVGKDDELQWSRECGRIFDVPDGAVITLGQIMARVHPDDRERVMRARRAAAEAQAPLDIEHRIVRGDGRLCWVRAHTSVERWNGVPRMVACVQDITDRKLADEARAHLVAIVEFADDAIVGATPEGIVTSWNRAAETLYKWSASEAIGRPTSILVLPENRDTVAPLLERLRAGEVIRHFETTHLRKDGATVEVVFTVSPIFDAEHRVIGSARIIRDLTERRQAESHLRQTEAQLLQAQKMEAIGVLAGGVAHDFNNMLSVILSFTSLVLDDLMPGDPRRADIQEIARAGERASDLTRQLLAFSRKQVLQPQVLDLGDAVRSMEKMLRRLLSEAIELSLVVPGSLGRVLADPGQIEQIVMNLAVNARDAMPSGGKLRIELSNVELDADYASLHQGVTPGPYVMVGITDTGVGMDAATRERIFEPFFTTKEIGRGTGLGLSTVFGIVKQSEGHIWVYSEPGRGTTFKVYFPRIEQAAETATQPGLQPETLRGTETVLLVEDEELVRATTRTILQRHGYNVLDAPSGGDALLICEQFPAAIHLLLTDVVMPRMSGRQVAERLAPIRPEMKVLYVSGYTEDAIVHHGVLDAGIAFLQKPITPNALLRKVREVLDG
jgi:PAS domain S-box-containing protein